MRTEEPLRGKAASLMRASNRSSIGRPSSFATSSRRLRRPANFFTRRCLRKLFSTALFFATQASNFPRLSISNSLPEREVERAQQGPRFRVCPCRRADHDIKSKHGFGLVVVDLGKKDVLLNAKRVVAAAVERLRIEPAEVAHPWQRHRHQPVEELVHARLAQCDLRSDRHVLAHFEGGDR